MAIQAGSSLRNVGGAFTETVSRGRRVASHLPPDHLRDKAAVWGVALMTEERCAYFQHALGDGAMRVVAIAAVLADGLMVVHERAAFFSVALVASIDHAVALHQFWTN